MAIGEGPLEGVVIDGEHKEDTKGGKMERASPDGLGKRGCREHLGKATYVGSL